MSYTPPTFRGHFTDVEISLVQCRIAELRAAQIAEVNEGWNKIANLAAGLLAPLDEERAIAIVGRIGNAEFDVCGDVEIETFLTVAGWGPEAVEDDAFSGRMMQAGKDEDE